MKKAFFYLGTNLLLFAFAFWSFPAAPLQVDPFSPAGYCWRCRRLFKPGEEVIPVTKPIIFRYGSHRKRWKGTPSLTFIAHKTCPSRG